MLKEIIKYDGLYVEIEANKNDVEQIKKELNIENNFNDYHTTLIYSKKPITKNELEKVKNFLKENYSNINIIGKVIDIIKFENPQEDIYAVALELDAPILEKIHKDLMKKFNLRYDYEKYIPHITLTYKGKNLSVEKLKEKLSKNFIIHYDKINVELLNENWANEVD